MRIHTAGARKMPVKAA